MTKRIYGIVASLCLIAAGTLCVSAFSAGLVLAGESPSHSRDLSGYWHALPPLDWIDPAKDAIPLTPEYALKLKKVREAADSGQPVADSVARCEAFGMPRIMGIGLFELLQTPGRVTMITEILHEVRRIYLDGRKPPADLDLSYEGYSTGHWENRVLVINTVGLQANSLDQYGIPHSDELSIIERMELIDHETLRDRVTLIDPKAYTKPWTVDRFYKRKPNNTEILEYICNTNNAAIPATAARQ
jgi:hypothetical protein